MSAVQDSAVEAVEVTPAMDFAGFDACEIRPGTGGFATGTDARRAIYRAMHRAAPASQDVATLREQRDELLEALEGICAMQEAFHGNGITTHLRLSGHCHRARELIAKAKARS